jgi:lipoprotein-releasing system ATP-binding protein
MTSPVLLEAQALTKSYGTLPVLKGVSLQLATGEVVALIGSSGAGKSTLLQILGTLDYPDSGDIQFEGKRVLTFSDKQQAQFRNKSLGFVFQFHHLMPEFSALENVAIPALIAGRSKNEAYQSAQGLLEQLGLADRMTHKPSQLSGGEQQRVSVARALVNRPKLILADEPTGNLDSANSEGLYEIIFKLSRETGVAFLIATHNPQLAAQADRILHIKDGVMSL